MSLSGNINFSTPNLQNENPLSDITRTVSTNTQNIAINTQDIESLNTRVGDVEEVNNTQDTNISANSSAITSLNTRVGDVETVNNTQDTNISANSSAITSLNTRVGDVEEVNTTQNGAISALDTRVGDVETVNNTQNTNISANSSAITSLNTRVGDVEDVNTTQNNTLTDILDRITDINYNAVANATVVGKLEFGDNSQQTTAFTTEKNTAVINLDKSNFSIAIGNLAGAAGQLTNSVSLGRRAGQGMQYENCVAIGFEAGRFSQLANSISIGLNAGFSDQQQNSIAIGSLAGAIQQGQTSISIGANAGRVSQGSNCVAIGSNAGREVGQGNNCVAIGLNAGRISQGQNSISIGTNAGYTNQHNNSIILNATGTVVNSDGTSRFFVRPIRSVDAEVAQGVIHYNPTTFELTYDTNNKITDMAYDASLGTSFSGHVDVGSLSVGGINILEDPIGKVQYGRYFDAPLCGQGGSSPLIWRLAVPDASFVNQEYHATILPTGTSNVLGDEYFMRFLNAGMYRIQIAWTITRNYAGTAVTSFFPTPPYYPQPIPDIPTPPYFQDPSNPAPDIGSGSGNSGSTTAQYDAAEYWVVMSSVQGSINVLADSFPHINAIQGHTFTGIDAHINPTLTTTISYPILEGRKYVIKGLIGTSSGERPNRFFIDMTFSLTETDSKDMYFHISGHVPTMPNDMYYFNVENMTYTITRLA
jgi:hypothetical protein